MSPLHPLARRLRRLRRPVERPPGLDALVDLDDMVGTLGRWATSMPWAVELPGPEPRHLMRRVALDCAELSCDEPWFVIDAAGDDLEDGPAVLVVLPTHIAHRGIVFGWAGNVVELDGDRTVASVALPTTGAELCALERLLMVAYSAAFRHADNPR